MREVSRFRVAYPNLLEMSPVRLFKPRECGMTEENDNKLVVVNAEIPLLPLKDIVVFPNMIVPVFINEDLCINAVENALDNERKIFLSAFQVLGKEGEGLQSNLEAPFDVYTIGTVCSIMRTRKLPDGRMKVLVQGLNKASVQGLVQSEPFPSVSIKNIQDPVLVNVSSEVEALVRAVREKSREGC